METTGRGMIDRWLANVSMEGVEAHDAGGSGLKSAATLPENNDQVSQVPQLLSPPRPNPNSLHILQTKRAREPLDKGQDSPGSRHAHKRKTQDYDRRPRHKPREHRYDYQGTGKPVERAHGNTKPKLRGRSRKQTMNDRFHAPNVARSSRLTLRPLASVGIFSKGKFSSPIQIRHGQYYDASDAERSKQEIEKTALTSATPGFQASLQEKLPFCKKHIPLNASTTNSAKMRRLLVDSHRSRDNEWLHFPHDNSRSKLGMNDASLRSNKSTHVLNEERAMTVKTGGPHVLSNDREVFSEIERSDHGAHQRSLDASQHKSSPRSPSATPYTWFGTDPRQAKIEHTTEDPLLGVHHVDMYAETDVQKSPAKRSGRYYKIEDLQKILEKRKKEWTEEASGNYSASFLSFIPISPLQRGITKSPGGTRCQSRHVKNMPRDDWTDVGPVFHQIDMLLQEIAGSQKTTPNSEGERLEIHTTEQGSLHEPKAELDIEPFRYAKEAQGDRRHMAPCDKFWLENDTSALLRGTLSAIQTTDSLEPSTLYNHKDIESCISSNFTNGRFMEQIPGPTPKSKNLSFSRTHPIIEHPNTYPLGFWRQNKLY